MNIPSNLHSLTKNPHNSKKLCQLKANMAPSMRVRGNGKATDDFTSLEPDKPNNLNLRRLVSSPKEKIDFMFVKKLTTQTYGILSAFQASSLYFPELLHFQWLGTLISYFGPYYPDLVRYFYSNLSIGNGCTVKSCVKGINIELSMEDFEKCFGCFL